MRSPVEDGLAAPERARSDGPHHSRLRAVSEAKRLHDGWCDDKLPPRRGGAGCRR